MSLHGVVNTANRNLEIHAHLNRWTVIALESFHHRTWNHLCWSFSLITGDSTFYHNGDLVETKQANTEGIDFAMKSSSKMHKASFIFGQEPDSIRGGFDQHQAYLGDLSEFNIWNYTLTKTEIHSMANCESFMKGNILSWDLTSLIIGKKLEIHNVTMMEFSRGYKLCDIHHQLVIFPQRVEYPMAKEICNNHGGILAVPHSEKENKLFIDIVKNHKQSCVADVGPTSENLVWIGAKQIDGTWHGVPRDRHPWSNISSSSFLNFTNFLNHSNCFFNK